MAKILAFSAANSSSVSRPWDFISPSSLILAMRSSGAAAGGAAAGGVAAGLLRLDLGSCLRGRLVDHRLLLGRVLLLLIRGGLLLLCGGLLTTP